MLNGLAAGSVALVLGSLVDDVPKAIELAPGTLVPQILFSGWIIPVDDIPSYLQWIQKICGLLWALKLLVIVEFEWAPDVKTKMDELRLNQGYWDHASPFKLVGSDPAEWYIYAWVLLSIFAAARIFCVFTLYYKGCRMISH